jgi:Cdc6-like AAA superfamily ATPase
VTDIQESLHDVSRNIDRVLHDREQQTILDWLTQVDYSPQQNDFIGRRQEGTGEWLVESDEFQHWENNKKCILFCPGIPGSGKTMIVSIVVDHLFKKFGNDPGIAIAFLYCNFRQQQEQRLIDLFLSLLKQFSQRQPLLPECVTRIYKAHERNRTRPSFSEISDALNSVIANCSRAFIIIDGLDECSATDRVLSRFMEELFSLQAKTGSSLFATSRPILGIPKEFERRESSILEICASDEDIRRYLDGHINQISTFVREGPGIERKIKSAIIKAADGM